MNNTKATILTLYFVGTPGTGKSAIAGAVAAALGMKVLEINDLVKEQSFFIGYDVFRDSLIIDEPLICGYLIPHLTKNQQVCLCGPVLELPPRLFDLIIVLRCNPVVLRQRLLARGYDTEKIEENVDAEIMEIVAEEAREIYGESCPICEIETTNFSPQQAADIVVKNLQS
jgi:adenylate kinase